MNSWSLTHPRTLETPCRANLRVFPPENWETGLSPIGRESAHGALILPDGPAFTRVSSSGGGENRKEKKYRCLRWEVARTPATQTQVKPDGQGWDTHSTHAQRSSDFLGELIPNFPVKNPLLTLTYAA